MECKDNGNGYDKIFIINMDKNAYSLVVCMYISIQKYLSKSTLSETLGKKNQSKPHSRRFHSCKMQQCSNNPSNLYCTKSEAPQLVGGSLTLFLYSILHTI